MENSPIIFKLSFNSEPRDILRMIRKVIFIIFLLALCEAPVSPATAEIRQTGVKVEYKIKAAFLLNFAKFITWPKESFSGADQVFNICVLGKNPFGKALRALESRKVGNRAIKLHYIDDIGQTDNCRLLFISASEKNTLETILVALGNRPVATVSDMQGFIHAGGDIEFVVRNKRLAFKINLAQANKQGVHINSSLLNLAVEVIR